MSGSTSLQAPQLKTGAWSGEVSRSRLTLVADNSLQLPCCLLSMDGLLSCRKPVKKRPMKVNVRESVTWDYRNSSRGAPLQQLCGASLEDFYFFPDI